MTQSRTRLRWSAAGLLALVAAVLVGGIQITRTAWFSRQVTRAVELAAEAATGEEVVIGRLDVHPWAGRVVVAGLVVTHRDALPERDGSTVLAVEQIHVQAGWRGGLVAQELRVVRPTLRLHMDPQTGLREFPGLTASPQESLPEAFPWDRLLVEDATVVVEGANWRIDLGEVQLRPDTRPGESRLDIGQGTVRMGSVERSTGPVALRHILLSPKRLVLPQFELGVDGLRLSGRMDLAFQGPLRAELEARSDLGSLGPDLPTDLDFGGLVHLDATVGGTLARPEVEGAVSVDALVVSTIDHWGDVRNYRMGDVRGGWSFADRVLKLEPLVVHWAGGTVEASGGLDVHTQGVWLSLMTDQVSLLEALQATGVTQTPWVDMEVDLELHAGGTLSPLRLAGSFELAGGDLRVASGPLGATAPVLAVSRGHLLGQVDLNAEGIRLNVRELVSRGSRAGVHAFVGFSPTGPLDIRAELGGIELAELRPLGGGELSGRATGVVRLAGPFDALALDGQLAVRDFGVRGYQLADEVHGPLHSADLRHLVFPTFQGTLGKSRFGGDFRMDFVPDTHFDLQLLLTDSRLEDLVAIGAAVPGVEADLNGSVSLEGPPSALDGEIELVLTSPRLFGEPFEAGQLIARLDGGRLTLDDARVHRDRGAEALWARGTVDPDGALNLIAMTGGLDLSRLAVMDPRLRGLSAALEADLQLGGSLAAPAPRGRVRLRQTRFEGRALGDSVLRFRTEGRSVQFDGDLAGETLRIEGFLPLDDHGAWRVQAAGRRVPLDVLLPTVVGQDRPKIHLWGDLVLDGQRTPDGFALDLGHADVEQVRLRWQQHRLATAQPFVWRWQDGGHHVRDLEVVGGRTRFAFGGTQNPDGRVMFAGGGDVDLDLLRAVVPGLQRAQGIADVRVSVSGDRSHAPAVVDVTVDDAVVQGDWFPSIFEGVGGTVSLRAESFTLSRVRGRLGGGSWTLSGVVGAQDWRPRTLDLRTQITDARVAYLDFLPPIVGDASLELDGPPDDLLLSGEITVEEMLFAERIDWERWIAPFSSARLLESAAEERTNWFSMDIGVTADRSVRVRNNVADLTASGQLRIIGDTRRPGLVGNIRALPDGRAYLKEREFELLRGEVRFQDPYSLDPDLDIALQTIVRSREEEYQVDYRVTGPYSAWRTETSSSPSLPQADINALLVFGMTREEFELYGGGLGALFVEGGDILASQTGVAERVVDGGVGIFRTEFLRPDRIDLASGVSARGAGAVTSELRLLVEKDLDVWELTGIYEQNLSRTSDWYLGFERRLARTLYSRAFMASEQYGRNLSIGGAYGVEVSARWELD